MSNNQLTGMFGVYYAAVELTKRKIKTALTARNAAGVDILASDHGHKHSWAIEVKTKGYNKTFWLMNKETKKRTAKSYVYILVAQLKDPGSRPDFYIVPSNVIAKYLVSEKRSNNRTYHMIHKKDVEQYKEKWSFFDK